MSTEISSFKLYRTTLIFAHNIAAIDTAKAFQDASKSVFNKMIRN